MKMKRKQALLSSDKIKRKMKSGKMRRKRRRRNRRRRKRRRQSSGSRIRQGRVACIRDAMSAGFNVVMVLARALIWRPRLLLRARATERARVRACVCQFARVVMVPRMENRDMNRT